MNNTTKNQQACDVICKKSCRLQSHERDLYRVCPSKLSKRELENLYFALLENNIELKKTVHSQQDKLKVLSTKLQRMTVVQRNAAGKEKDCCNSKVLVKEQKEIIEDLKKANEQMSDRIRLLNMRLCSAKQFLKRSPSQYAKCPRCGICPVSKKNSSMSAIDAKLSQANVKMMAASCQYIPIEAPEVSKSTRDVQTETDQEVNMGTEKQCNENKCRTVMDELKQKIVNLQEELSKTHDEYSKRISKLENDVSGLHQENTRVRSSQAASEHSLQQREKKANDLRGKLRGAEGELNDLKMQLTIEKRKVKELETTLKLAHTSNQVVKLMEKLNTTKRSDQTSEQRSDQKSEQRSDIKNNLLSPTPSVKLKEDTKFPKSDDSGCTDLNKSSDAEESKASYMERLNQEMSQKISALQMQLDDFRIKAAGQSVQTDNERSPEVDNHECDEEVQMTVITITDPNVVLEIQQLGDERKDSNPEKDIETSTPIKDTEPATVSSKTDPPNVKSWNDLVKRMGQTSCKTDEFGTTSKHSSFDTTNPSEAKRDDESKYQIPGPISTTFPTYKDKKKSFKNGKITSKDKTEKESKDLAHKKGLSEGKGVIINDASDNAASDNKTSDKQVKIDLKTDAITPVKTNETSIKNVDSPKGISQKITIVDPKEAPVTNEIVKTSEDVTSNLNNLYPFTPSQAIPTKESNGEDVKKVQSKAKSERTTEELAEVKRESSSSYFYRSDTAVTPSHSVGSRSSKEKVGSAQTDKAATVVDGRMEEFGVLVEMGQWPPPAPPTTAKSKEQPTLPQAVPQSAPRRDSATYTAMPVRRDSGTYTAMPIRRDSGTYTAMPARRDSATFTKSDESEECKCERATSPANTERDVSSLSDLPPEKDGKCPGGSPPASSRGARSPGEQKATTTYSDSDTRTYEYGPLSDGELPTQATLRPRKLSFGEQPTYAHPVAQSSEVQMEATLNAISAELAHCRKLLAAARDHEMASAGSSVGAVEVPYGGGGGGGRERVHRLHAAPASRRLPERAACSAIFTLHIGTLVLSDEAVLSSRDKTLLLTWQFYEQAVTMTRMRAGRVVLFDFSTEYDVAFNDDFLNYMKHEEMPLTICDINKQEEPFATCWLPLRDALINTNRRADMSLALMAGPAFRAWSGGRAGRAGSGAADTLVAGDELGVLDLWCCLRAPPRLPRHNDSSIARSVMMDPTSEEFNLAPSSSRADVQSADDDQDNRVSQDMVLGPRTAQGVKPLLTFKTGSDHATAKIGRDWSYDRRSSNTRPSIIDVRSSRSRSSSMMASEVPVTIRSTAEMKQALESRVPEGLHDMLKEERKISMVAAAAAAKETSARKKRVPFSQNSQDTDPTPQNKYNNIGQFIGLNKILEQSKKTVTYTDAAPSSARESTATRETSEDNLGDQSLDITVLWLALNEECEAMVNPQVVGLLEYPIRDFCFEVRRLYVAYSFLGRRGAELETPISLPKPKHYAEKCYFNFKKTFNLHEADLPLLGHMSRCRAGRAAADPRDSLVFTVVSEPPEDPLGLSACEDIGHAYLYLGDILAYSAGGAGYTEVVPVRAVRAAGAVCGVLAVRVDGLHVLRRCLTLSHSSRDLAQIP